jgi:hypothetical protein
MAVEIDTATDYADLLDKLVTFATANGWTELENTSDKVVLSGEGSGSEEIIVAFQKYSDVPGDAYGLHINAYSGYSSGLTFFNQPGASNEYRSMPLWNSTIPYWFIVSERRIIVVAKVSTTYQMAYAGFFLPYASPGQYPYPMMIGGSYYGDAAPRYSNASSIASSFWSGLQVSGDKANYAVRLPSGVWSSYRNFFDTTSFASGTTYNTQKVQGIVPYCFALTNWTASNVYRGTVDGDDVLVPLEIWLGGNSSAGFVGMQGEIDGVFFVTGSGHGAEDIITIDGDDYLVVQNVFRTGVTDYAAVRLT